MPGGSSPSGASTAWTATRWPWTWPSSRSGWPRWPRTTPSRSSTTRCGPAIRWWGCRRSRSPRSTGPTRERSSRDFFRDQIEETMKRVDGLPAEDPGRTGRCALRAPAATAWTSGRRLVDMARFVGDLVIAAYFSAEKDKQRERNLNALTAELAKYLGPPMKMEHRHPLAEAVNKLRSGDRPVTPFHWEIEFPEVFGQESQGFDAIVGNPPFLGSSRISEVSGSPVYQHWLKELVAPSKGQIDLSVFFFQRVFFHLRSGGSFGLLATSAISFGENRIAGLAQLISMGGTIISATTARPWPGEASVIVSIVHIWKEASAKVRDSAVRNGMPCNFINSRLQARKEFGEPSPLQANAKMAHKGTQAASDGFTLDLPEATALLSDEHNRKVVLPLTGGEEVNAPPSRQLRRFCICFRSMGLEEAVRWPEVLDIVRERVLPQRLKAKDHGPGAHGKKYWWQHVIRADLLYEAIAGLDRCLVTSRVSTYHAIRFEPAAPLQRQGLRVCVRQLLIFRRTSITNPRGLVTRELFTPWSCRQLFNFKDVLHVPFSRRS